MKQVLQPIQEKLGGVPSRTRSEGLAARYHGLKAQSASNGVEPHNVC